MKLVAMVTDPRSVTRYLAGIHDNRGGVDFREVPLHVK